MLNILLCFVIEIVVQVVGTITQGVVMVDVPEVTIGVTLPGALHEDVRCTAHKLSMAADTSTANSQSPTAYSHSVQAATAPDLSASGWQAPSLSATPAPTRAASQIGQHS